MRNLIKSAPKFAAYSSFDKLAATLIESESSCAVFQKSGKTLAPRSLSAKIGMLDKGDKTWWVTRPNETKCLVDLLGLELDDLGLHQKSGRQFFDFAVFPEIPVLDLIREDTWKIAEPRIPYEPTYGGINNQPTLDGWLKSTGYCRREQVEWLYVPDEVEYQLLTRKLALASRHDFLPIKSLDDVLKSEAKLERFFQDESLILAIETSMTFEDVQTLAEYRRGTPLLIVSLSLRPEKFTNQPEKALIKINDWTWTLLPNWRELLLGWVHNRINSSKRAVDRTDFDKQDAIRLLEKFDPSQLLFVSVKDVLVLCNVLHKNSGKHFKSQNIDQQLLSLFEADEQSSDTLSSLVQARWNRWDLSWAGELPQADWLELANALCKFNDLTPHLIVRGMKGYDFQRPPVIRLLLRSYLSKKLIEGALAFWAPACFDRDRRPMVDDALDAISLNELELVAMKFMQDSASAQDVGAGEAIFTAIGRRIIRKHTVSNKLSEFAGHLIKRLRWDAHNKDFLRPWSLQVENPKVHMEWVSACWAWSLQPAPSIAIPSTWLFPGWGLPLTQELPEWLNGSRTNLNYFGSNWEWQPTQLMAFLTVVERWMKTQNTPPCYRNSLPLFDVALLARAAHGDWPAEAGWWLTVIGQHGSPQVQKALLYLVRSDKTSVNQCTALNWWPSLIQSLRKDLQQRGGVFSRQTISDLFARNPMITGYSELVVWVMEKLKEHTKEALEALQEEDRRFLAMNPSSLPMSFKRELLKWLSKNISPDWQSYQLLNLLSRYGSEMMQDMEAFLDSTELGDQAARHLWEWAPNRAKNLLEDSLTQTATQNLIRCCPASALGCAIKLLKNNPTLLQEERMSWARWYLPDARQHTQDLMELIESA